MQTISVEDLPQSPSPYWPYPPKNGCSILPFSPNRQEVYGDEGKGGLVWMAPGLSGVLAMLQTEQPISLVDPLRVDGREGLSSRLPSWLLGQSQTVHPTSGQTARLTCGGGACLSYQSVEEEEGDIRQGVEKKRKRKKHIKQGHITYCVQAPGAIPAHKQTAVYCVRVGEGRIPPEPWFFVFFF